MTPTTLAGDAPARNSVAPKTDGYYWVIVHEVSRPQIVELMTTRAGARLVFFCGPQRMDLASFNADFPNAHWGAAIPEPIEAHFRTCGPKSGYIFQRDGEKVLIKAKVTCQWDGAWNAATGNERELAIAELIEPESANPLLVIPKPLGAQAVRDIAELIQTGQYRRCLGRPASEGAQPS